MKYMKYWMVSQALMGIWLFISWVMGYKEMADVATNSFVIGAVVVIRG